MSAPSSPELSAKWKSLFSQKLASKKIMEEFEYFAKVYEKLDKNKFQGPDAVIYALQHASKRSNPSDLVDDKRRAKTLPEGSKICIVGAGMAAMRFPEIPIMTKTFNLFKHLGHEKVPLIPYYMVSPKGDSEHNNQPSRYNDRTIIGYKEPDDKIVSKDFKDDFHVSETHGGRIMPELVNKPSRYVSEAFEPFKSRLRANWNKGFQALMKYDEFSVRGFMMSHGITPLGSGLYDQGFSEGVIDSMDFDYYSSYIDKKSKVDWYCVDGGTQLVPEAMNASLKKPLAPEDLGKRVTKIAIARSERPEDNRGDPDTNLGESSLKVQVSGEKESRNYMTVFATPTLACLQRIDLTGLELLYEQKDAIRSLHYDTATKVGMKFKRHWWIDLGIEGGLGTTDMPLRTCVYPSYNLDDPGDKPAVLLCSYSWSQDAARMGSLMKGKPEEEVQLRELLFNNLTWLHIEHYKQKHLGISDSGAFRELYDVISSNYITHHAFDWHNHEWTSGAYGKFGPGQFSQVYTNLSCPIADSRFHFVGEGISEHHGWIVGALDSAHQAVLNFLRRFELHEYVDKLNGLPWVKPVPEGMDEETSYLKVLLGLLKPERRLEARAAVEKGKMENVEVKVGNGIV
ncbi:MAG: hypothetical protein Q9165_002859 [Trypethelium subeluteriae]